MNEASNTGIPEFFHLVAAEVIKKAGGKVVAPPPVGARVRYHGSLTHHHGLFDVVKHLGDEGQVVPAIEISNGEHTLQCRPGSVTQVPVESPFTEARPGNNPFVAPEVPPVGATVRYHGSLTDRHGIYRVRSHIGTPGARMIEIGSGQRSLQCRPSSVTVVLPSAQRRPNIPVGRKRIHAERSMLVWYSGSVRGLHGVARVLDARPTGLTLRSGVGASSGCEGLRFTCRYSSVSRVTVAEIGRQGSACMTCSEWVSHTVSGLKCRGCGRRVVAATMSLQDFHRNGDTVVWPGDWLPEVAYEIARKTCK